MTIACQFSQLNIEFNQEALFPPLTHSLTCQRNALIGQNGKGKSVLLKLLAQNYCLHQAISCGVCLLFMSTSLLA